MTLRAAIAASMAYDTIMVFEGQFTDHILPDQIHKINLSFLSPRMRREYGGCAGNIAYNYKLVGGEPVPIGMVGDDFGPYLEHYQRWGIDASCLVTAKDAYTAQCFIVTDLHNNQLAGFHPGAMGLSAQIPVAQAGARGLRPGGPRRQGRDAAAHAADGRVPACPSSWTRDRTSCCSAGRSCWS